MPRNLPSDLFLSRKTPIARVQPRDAKQLSPASKQKIQKLELSKKGKRNADAPKRRWKKGTVAIREIKKFQKSTD